MSLAEASASIPLSARGPASKRVTVGFGFWLFLLSDIIMFSAFFATHAVLGRATAGGPTGPQLFDRGHAFLETACLLASSFTCGLGAISTEGRRLGGLYLWGAVTFVLGAAFLYLEVTEFAAMVARGAGPDRSAFLSAFFALVGAHGLHVTLGLVWLVVMLVQAGTIGFRPFVVRRLLCFSLFWHALDIVWIALFTTVYLIGGLS
ncbi:MAG: cytochrome (ubi)quinol oxidase subunit III [Rhizomicrobium sp.]